MSNLHIHSYILDVYLKKCDVICCCIYLSRAFCEPELLIFFPFDNFIYSFIPFQLFINNVTACDYFYILLVCLAVNQTERLEFIKLDFLSGVLWVLTFNRYFIDRILAFHVFYPAFRFSVACLCGVDVTIHRDLKTNEKIRVGFVSTSNSVEMIKYTRDLYSTQ